MDGAAQRQRLARRADELHPAAAHGHGVGERVRIVDGVDARVDENQVGRGGGGRLALGVGARGTASTDDEERGRGETSHDNHFR